MTNVLSYIVLNLTLSILIGVMILVFVSDKVTKAKSTPSKKTFQIVLSEGMYDIRLNGRRLTSKFTLDEAKQWLEYNRSNYLKEDSLIYEESYEKATKIS